MVREAEEEVRELEIEDLYSLILRYCKLKSISRSTGFLSKDIKIKTCQRFKIRGLFMHPEATTETCMQAPIQRTYI